MKASNTELIDDLIERTKSNMNRVEVLKELTDEQLNRKPSSEKWNVLECIEHLNRYAAFYNPEIKQRLVNAKKSTNGGFKSSWLGEYFAQIMLPKEKLNKMNTLKDMNPHHTKVDSSILDQFLSYQRSY